MRDELAFTRCFIRHETFSPVFVLLHYSLLFMPHSSVDLLFLLALGYTPLH
jgi:hypothetical protein